jgi:hypothetical protein
MLKAEGESSPLWVEVKQRLSEEEVASQLKVGGCLCRA